MSKYALLLISVICLSNHGCGKGKVVEPDNTDNPATTPLENESAELMAMWLSGDLIAPPSLYEEIKLDFETIEADLGESLEQWDDSVENDLPDSGWDISFTPHWKVSRVSITFDSSTFESIKSEQNEDWKRVTDEMHMERSLFCSSPGWRTVELYFQGRRNSRRLAEGLADFPGVEKVGIVPAGSGGWSNIIPYSHSAGRRYFYRFAWGDCPSGCANEDVYYLAVNSESVQVLGAYRSLIDSARFPLWWDTANTAIQTWRDN